MPAAACGPASYPRLRAGAAATAMILGAIGITVSVPGACYIMDGRSSSEHYGAPLIVLAGAFLLASGIVTLVKARRNGEVGCAATCVER
jgi:hypothetical protein